MKAVAPHDRPREKLERLGAAGLGDNELLALVIGSGSYGRNALDLANDLLDAVGGTHGLTRVAIGDLQRVAGIGHARAAQVLAAVELGRRTMTRGGTERPRLRSPAQLAAYLLPL
jgi:DNA repair protein RadC